MKNVKSYLDNATIMPVLSVFEKWFTRINKNFFEDKLPQVTITIQRDNKTGHATHGWMSCAEVWHKGEAQFYELNMTAHSLSRPIEESISTLIHEMCHLYANVNDIKDVARVGQYHNGKFKEIAESHGLKCDAEKDPKIGWSHTVPTEDTIEWINSFDHKQDDEILTMFRDRDQSMKKTAKKTTYKYVCPVCGAIVRTTKELHIICGDCECAFEMEEKRD